MIDEGFVSHEHVYEQAAKGEDALILASGGLDSAVVLWHYAQVVKDRPIHVHHLDLWPEMRLRYKLENFFLDRQIEYIGKDRVKLYKSSVHIDPDAGPPLRDVWWPILMSLSLCRKGKFKHLVCGADFMYSWSKSQGLAKPDEELEAIKMLVKSATLGRTKLSWESEKANFIRDNYLCVPKDYLKLCFSCRKPTFTDTHVEKCGECRPCIKYEELNMKELLWKRMRIDGTHME